MPVNLAITEYYPYKHGTQYGGKAQISLVHGQKPSDEFEFQSRGDVAIVTTPAKLGHANAQRFWEVLAAACVAHKLVVVDMTWTGDCDPDAAVALLLALRYSDSARTEIRIAVSPAMRALVGSTALWRALAYFDTLAEALRFDTDMRRRPRLRRLACATVRVGRQRLVPST